MIQIQENKRLLLYANSILTILILSSILMSTIFIGYLSTPSFAQQTPNRATPSSPSNLSIYQNSTYGIEIQYPSHWLYRENNRTNIVTFMPPSGLNFILSSVHGNFSKSLTNNTSIPPLVTVGMQFLPFYNMPLSFYSNLTINSLKLFPNFHIIQSSPTTLGGYPGNVLAYSQGPIATAVAYTIVGNKAYIIAFAANSAEYSTYIPVAQRMINSLIINSTACTISLC